MVAVGSADGIVDQYSLTDRSSKGRFESHGMPVTAICYSQSGKKIISAGEDLHIFVSDSQTQQRTQTMVGHLKQITDVCAHPLNDDVYISASLD